MSETIIDPTIAESGSPPLAPPIRGAPLRDDHL
jgi:hypothetical protein